MCLVGVVVRRYIDFLILLIPTPLVSALFCSNIPTFCSFSNVFHSCILVGCKHRASEGVFYIGDRGCVLCQFIQPVMFASCAFIFCIRNVEMLHWANI